MNKDEKRFSKTILALVVVIAPIFLSCHKRPFDERNKFIGKWTFKNIHMNRENGRTPMYILDSTVFVGEINYHTARVHKGTLEIGCYPGGDKGHFKLAENGTLVLYDTVGKITENTINMIITNENSGVIGLGSGNDYTITAVKNK